MSVTRAQLERYVDRTATDLWGREVPRPDDILIALEELEALDAQGLKERGSQHTCTSPLGCATAEDAQGLKQRARSTLAHPRWDAQLRPLGFGTIARSASPTRASRSSSVAGVSSHVVAP